MSEPHASLLGRLAAAIAGLHPTRIVRIAIDGVEPTLENFERGAYPYRKYFRFVFAHGTKPAVERFIAFLRSAEGERLLREAGNLAPRP